MITLIRSLINSRFGTLFALIFIGLIAVAFTLGDVTGGNSFGGIGGGNAALCAALMAREAGASVVLLEAAPREWRGGNSMHTRNLRCMHDAPQDVLTDAYPEQEFWQEGIGFNKDRFCRPFISERVLWEVFGDDAIHARQFLQVNEATGTYDLKPEFESQQKVQQWMDQQPASDLNIRLRDGLFNLIANVILLQDEQGNYHFRFGIDKTTSFRYLDDTIKAKINALYINYFFRRQDDFWQREAMEKLPALKRGTNMLICGEDLGMVPGCVPDVMNDLGILSLEIQRMPKKTGSTFFHPKDALYLSVVTPSTHDMSTIRGWWEEDRKLSQRFYNEQLQREGDAPFFCEPWINRAIIEQHIYSPAMWSIFQLQDLMGSDGDIRRENPNDERINVPANPKHYWQYRMHLSLEDLMGKKGFNADLKEMLVGSGRG